ncbi:hypothetical protein Thivi_0040 [Thiocystis violascens DSM 198]|uniref:Uncharacterized protein n=1 Tax=Thiocystis violascens (strain ATCC 17096 / DSM 198 / 6111) TaxID=765911 RepID=I3Y563_THIV6|nr:hypothetical protein Thivi_0040 [Thiocystis violascens DSM 198]
MSLEAHGLRLITHQPEIVAGLLEQHAERQLIEFFQASEYATNEKRALHRQPEAMASAIQSSSCLIGMGRANKYP